MTAHAPHGHGHGHGQGHDHELDWEALAADIERDGEIHLRALERAARWLRDLHASGRPVTRILDVGSGPGVATCLLAQAFPEAEVVAVDGGEGLLRRALERAAEQGVADRVRVLHADLPDGLSKAGEADVIWSSKFIHHLGDQQAALTALAGLLRPGGVLGIAEGGLPPRCLPRDIGLGRPGLQARLDAASDTAFAEMRANAPGSTAIAEDWPAMLTGAGLTAVPSRSFLTDLPAPLDEQAREHVWVRLNRTREQGADLLADDDRQVLAALLDGDGEHGVRTRRDVFYLDAITVHAARMPAAE
ncbi:methyltransferase domain-containing protein [Streptosporangiaceae bacterium NEAU-GS5]|nr:methyltransferase domain-containing protein [Streptosporangiaceae bacterium NEAU-GS5]